MFGQQRSQSGPSGLSINTGAANLFPPSSNATQGGGLFGSPKPTTSLFGATAPAPSAGTLFGTSTTTTQGGSLFGGTATAPSQAGTLFGGSAATQSAQAPGTNQQPQQTSLFGGQQQSTGNVFGGQTTAQPQQQNSGAQPTQGTSLFGNTTAAQPQQGASLFGNHSTSNATAQPQQAASLFGTQTQQSGGQFGSSQQGGSMFGSTAQQNKPGLFGSSQAQQPQAGLWGNTRPQQQQQGTTLFGSTQNQQPAAQSLFNKPNQFGTSQNTQRPSFAQSHLNPQNTQRPILSASIGQYSAQQAAIPGVRIDLTNIRPTTRYDDLHESLQKDISDLDNFILSQMQLHTQCEQAMPRVASAFSHMPTDVSLCARQLEALQQGLENDAGAIGAARELVAADADAARLSFGAIQNLRMPAQFHHAGLWNNAPSVAAAAVEADGETKDLVGYFSKQADEMERRRARFQRDLDGVEAYLGGLEGSIAAQVQSLRFSRGRDGGVRSADEQVRELAAVLREFEGGILAVAGKVGGAREAVQEAVMGEGLGRRRR